MKHSSAVIRLARSHRRAGADLILGNNVLAHVPDINDFVGGLPLVLKAEGVVTLEFPHLLNLLVENQFDTIYHEHYGYLSLTALVPIFARSGLRIFDVETAYPWRESEGFLCHSSAGHAESSAVAAMLAVEHAEGLTTGASATTLSQSGFLATKRDLLAFPYRGAQCGKSVRIRRGRQGQYLAELLRCT